MPFDWMNVPPSCFCARNFVPKTARSTPVPGYKNRGGGWRKMEAPTHEENKSRSRHNVEGSFLCVLYFGWPNQPSSGTMIILHWYVIFMLHVV